MSFFPIIVVDMQQFWQQIFAYT